MATKSASSRVRVTSSTRSPRSQPLEDQVQREKGLAAAGRPLDAHASGVSGGEAAPALREHRLLLRRELVELQHSDLVRCRELGEVEYDHETVTPAATSAAVHGGVLPS